jgi:drug/metabolite transporter (DMT)-like permease
MCELILSGERPPPSKISTMRPYHVFLLVTLSIIWGSAFMMIDVALDDVPPLTLVAGRVVGAFLFLLSVLLITGKSLPRDLRSWRALAFLGVVNNAWPFLAITWGQERVDSNLAAILVASMPLSVTVIAHFWIDERLTLERAIGVLVGFGGVFLLIGGDLGDITGSGTLGQLAVIGGAVGYAIGTVFARHYLQDAEPLETAAGQTLVASLVMIPLALLIDQPFDIRPDAASGLSWVGLALGASGIAYLIYFRLVSDVSATQASMVTYLIPVTAVILGVLVLDETVELSSLGGLALIIAGIWFVNGGTGWLRQRGSTSAISVPEPALADEAD